MDSKPEKKSWNELDQEVKELKAEVARLTALLSKSKQPPKQHTGEKPKP